MTNQKMLPVSSENAAKSIRNPSMDEGGLAAMPDPLLTAAMLQTILDRLAKPGALAADPFVRSWVVQTYVAQNPAAGLFTPEFLIGQALEHQILIWSGEYRLHPAYAKVWNGIFCLKAAYFQKERRLNLYRARPTLAQLGAMLVDGEALAHLVPGREHEAEALQKDPSLNEFWRSFTAGRGESLSDSTVSSRLKRAIRNFVAWLERRRTQQHLVSATEPSAADSGAPTGEAQAAAGVGGSAVASVATSEAPKTSQASGAQLVSVSLEETNPALAFRDAAPTGGGNVFEPVRAYLELSLLSPHIYVPPEWAAIIETAATSDRVMVQGRPDTGKTCLLHAIGDALGRLGVVPLYLRLPEYAPFAVEMDVLRYAATRGAFGQPYRDERAQRAFESALAEAMRDGRLVLLADDSDDLLENELAAVAARLRDVRRLVLAERQARLPLERVTSTALTMPVLSVDSESNLLHTLGLALNLSSFRQLEALGLGDNQALVMASTQSGKVCGTLVEPARLLSEWVERRLKRARQTGAGADARGRAQRLMQNLAAIRLGLQHGSEPSLSLGRTEMIQAFARMALKIEQHSEGWALVDWISRAGLLERTGEKWWFSYPALLPYFAAGDLIDGERYGEPRTRLQHETLRWVAALLALHGDEQQLRLFTKRAIRSLQSYTPVSVLDVADYLSELKGLSSPAVEHAREDIDGQLRRLAGMNSPRVRSAAEERRQRLATSQGLVELAATSDGMQLIGLPRAGQPGTVNPTEILKNLDAYATDLAGLLRGLNLLPPKGTEREWLEQVTVQDGLIGALCSANDVAMKLRCAAWLQRSSLTQKIVLQMVPLRRSSMLERLADVASDGGWDEATRTAARSALAREEFIVRLWQLGDSYEALVYDLLLAMGKRLYREPDSGRWVLVE